MMDLRIKFLLENQARPNTIYIFTQVLRLADDKGWCSREELIDQVAISRNPAMDAISELVNYGVTEARQVGRIWIYNPTLRFSESDRAESDSGHIALKLSESDRAESDSGSDPTNSPGRNGEMSESDRAWSDSDISSPEPLTRTRTLRSSSSEEDNDCTSPPLPPQGYQDQVLPPESQPKILEYSGPDPGPPPEIPPTDDRLQAAFDHLEEQLRPQIWRTMFAPAAMTLEDNQVVFWTTGEKTGRHLQDQYLNPLLQAFGEVHGKVPDKPIQFRVPVPGEVGA